jgi:hypothetical protein
MSNEFIIVDWSMNQIYTVFENFKGVKKGDIVTCFVNNAKDIGRVIYVGMLANLLFLKNLKINFKLSKITKRTASLDLNSTVTI